jgi:hypothetical protein
MSTVVLRDRAMRLIMFAATELSSDPRSLSGDAYLASAQVLLRGQASEATRQILDVCGTPSNNWMERRVWAVSVLQRIGESWPS